MVCFAGSAASAATLLLWGAVTAATAAPGQAAATTAVQRGSTRLLEVPFLSQTEDLCGGAALAMVMRYWGERQVYPDDFAALVDRSAAGIRTDVLTGEVRRRGWQSIVVDTTAGSGTAIVDHLDQGRPVVALIEVRPNRYHYVVVVASTVERVIIHDPARAPFQVLSQLEFDRAWAAAGRWALLVLPGDNRAGAPTASAKPPAPAALLDAAPAAAAPVTGTCGRLVETLVAQARAGDLVGAERGLLAAVSLCPRDPAAWRELAGIRFLQSRWGEATQLAERAARLDPNDEQGGTCSPPAAFSTTNPILRCRRGTALAGPPWT